MAYTTIDKPSDYFNTKLYTGNGGTNAITGVGFQPDWVWLKDRTTSEASHKVYDSVRGTTKYLAPNNTGAEATESGVTAFGSDGFTLGSAGGTNGNGISFVSWNWKAGTSFTNDASSTGIGNIDSTGSVNTDAGFSVISYTGDANADNTVAHGLGSVPKMIILKNRSISSNWMVYHASTGAQAPLFLNLNNAAGSGDPDRFKVVPTSSVFTPGSAQEGNGSGNSIIAYCFSEKKAFSKFGSYTGNGSTNGSYIHLGFSPAFVMVKRTDSTANWQILDNKRNTYNPWNTALFPDTTDPDTTDYSTDHLSNGFKLRVTTTSRNGSGASYIYMAFAENPFVSSSGVPACAR